jgi:hypothetical protein
MMVLKLAPSVSLIKPYLNRHPDLPLYVLGVLLGKKQLQIDAYHCHRNYDEGIAAGEDHYRRLFATKPDSALLSNPHLGLINAFDNMHLFTPEAEDTETVRLMMSFFFYIPASLTFVC